MRKVTRNEINKNRMVALGYCQCQTILNLFAYKYKVGYNSGIYGWNCDLYTIGDIDIVTGYRVPYRKYSNERVKKELIALENEMTKNFDYSKLEEYRKRFLEIFK